MARNFKIKKDDDVIVLTGRDKGKRGKVLRLMRSEERAVVEGVNVVKRHTRPSQSQPGGILGHRDQLAALGVRVVTDQEAVQRVRILLRRRDEHAQAVCARTGEPLPEWVGQD